MALLGTQIHVGHYVRWQQYHLAGLFTSGIAQCELEQAPDVAAGGDGNAATAEISSVCQSMLPIMPRSWGWTR